MRFQGRVSVDVSAPRLLTPNLTKMPRQCTGDRVPKRCIKTLCHSYYKPRVTHAHARVCARTPPPPSEVGLCACARRLPPPAHSHLET